MFVLFIITSSIPTVIVDCNIWQYRLAIFGYMAKKVATTVYITDEQQKKLKVLNDQTKVPIAEYIRQGIDIILERNSEYFPGQLDLPLNNLENTPASGQESQKFTEV